MLLPQFGECRDRYVECVLSVMLFYAVDVGLRKETLGLLECAEVRPRLLVDVVGQGGKDILFLIVEKAAFLEQERRIFLTTDLQLSVTRQYPAMWGTHIISGYRTDFRRARVRDRNDLDQLGISDSVCLCSRKQRVYVDVPFCRKPGQRLRGDY